MNLFTFLVVIIGIVTSRPLSLEKRKTLRDIGYPKESIVDLFGGKHKRHRAARTTTEEIFDEKELLSRNSLNDETGDEMNAILEDVIDWPKEDNNQDLSEDDMFLKKRRELDPVYITQLDKRRKKREIDKEDKEYNYKDHTIDNNSDINSEYDKYENEKDYGDDLLPNKKSEDDADEMNTLPTHLARDITTSEIYIPVDNENDVNIRDLTKRSISNIDFDTDTIPDENKYSNSFESKIVDEYNYVSDNITEEKIISSSGDVVYTDNRVEQTQVIDTIPVNRITTMSEQIINLPATSVKITTGIAKKRRQVSALIINNIN